MSDKNKKARRKGRRKPNPILQLLNAILLLIVIGIIGVFAALYFGAKQFHAEGPATEEAVFLVPSGASLASVAADLEQQGLIENEFVFRFATLMQKKSTNIKAGEFRIPAGSSMAAILHEITEGNPIVYQVTIPEGFTSWQVVERLKAAEHLVGEIEALPPEGSLLPNTYAYERGDTRQSILEAMAGEHETELAKIWANRAEDLPIETPQELTVLASIIEKETAVAEERPRVAAVFVNRLKAGMRLQSDPTIIYGITQGQGPLGRGLRKSEIEAETPYNTYVINGLPPGPIANPGVESLRAAANPAETKDLYFVADGTGGHAFAENYEDHQRNVAEWRRIEAERERIAREQEAQEAADAADEAAIAEVEEDGAEGEETADSAGSDSPVAEETAQ
jgi:UPF0755 protein